MSNRNNAIDFLMNNAKNNGKRKRFPCPAGCGRLVTEQDVNDHLDRCFGMSPNPNADDTNSNDGRVDRKAAHCLPQSAQKVNEPATKRLHKSSTSPLAKTPPKKNASESNGNDAFSHMMQKVNESATKRLHKCSTSPFAKTPPKKNASDSNGNDAFSHMMKRSAKVFSKPDGDENLIRHRFHLHNAEGYVTWTSVNNGDENNNEQIINTDEGCDMPTKSNSDANSPTKTDETKADNPTKMLGAASPLTTEEHWSATVTIKKMKSVNVDSQEVQDTPLDNNTGALELTISSSIPPSQADRTTQRLVRRHSRLSVSHLKSCLQKSIRRRAPLPAVRVAMELADKSWGDLIRRLPIIVLEDSSLHPDFGLLVWLMVAESKGYFPCMALLKRVFQIIFEVASCPRQDILSGDECEPEPESHRLPSSISLTTPTNIMFPDEQPSKHTTTNACEVFLRSMLLRAQYGGMKCDVKMLHLYAITWLKRFQTMNVPTSFTWLAPESSMQPISWLDVPRILHEKAREKSIELVTADIVRPGGILSLTSTDVCSAGIDFHCSSVVDHLLSQHDLYQSLCERLAQLTNSTNGYEMADKEWISGQMKSMIWNYSSGINHRRSFEVVVKKKEDPILKAPWVDALKSPFESYTKKFVRDRLP